MIIGRMGAVTPPPVIAAQPEVAPASALEPIPQLPAAPLILTGSSLPPEKPPKKPGGG